MKIIFKKPKKYNVAILYSDDFWIRFAILGKVSSITIPIYPNKIVIEANYSILYSFFLNLFLYKFKRDENLIRFLYKIYLISIFDCIDAKIIITYIDNSDFFYEISDLDRKNDDLRTYIAVQNGARTNACVRFSRENKKNIINKKAILYCYGERDVDLYKKNGHQIIRHIPIGSLVSGYFKSVVSKHGDSSRKGICFISQWHQEFYKDEALNNDYAKVVSRQNRVSINILVSYLNQLSLETNLILRICLRSNNIEEEKFYKEKCPKIEILKKEKDGFSTYRIAEKSELVIALNSTVLSEVFLWDNKVLWCNPLSIQTFSMPDAGISYIEGSYQDFKDRVQYLISLENSEYKNLTENNSKYINSLNISTPPHLIIYNEIISRININ